jgi:hypothetical protein
VQYHQNMAMEVELHSSGSALVVKACWKTMMSEVGCLKTRSVSLPGLELNINDARQPGICKISVDFMTFVVEAVRLNKTSTLSHSCKSACAHGIDDFQGPVHYHVGNIRLWMRLAPRCLICWRCQSSQLVPVEFMISKPVHHDVYSMLALALPKPDQIK